MLSSVNGRLRGCRNGLMLSVFCVAACNTYDSSLLTVSLDPALTAGAGPGTSGSAGAAEAGKSSVGGIGGVGGMEEDAGASSANAGAGSAGEAESAGAGGSAGGGGEPTVAGGGGASGSAGKAAGGSSGVAGSAGAGGSSPYEVIDDFQDQDAVLYPLRGRNGPWYPIADATATGVKAMLIVPLGAENAREGSTAALHFTASGFMDWGAGVGADLVNVSGGKVPYSVAAYKGIRFFAKVATGSQTTLKLLVPTTFSDALGGKCHNSVANQHCDDHLFCQVTGLKTTWAAYQCDFSALRPQMIAGALPQPTFDPATVYGIQFSLLDKPLPIDLWIDDLSFVLK